ncbi:hypothetical protein HAX54_011749 [Datura stramonium]|uniref:Uncharacterized protein n=1 Tax=Datura stramonium TaxID=4076 RepID=A0ABS8TK95_DATST|nr:hypothetical protein [Datura stramonium]
MDELRALRRGCQRWLKYLTPYTCRSWMKGGHYPIAQKFEASSYCIKSTSLKYYSWTINELHRNPEADLCHLWIMDLCCEFQGKLSSHSQRVEEDLPYRHMSFGARRVMPMRYSSRV